MKKLLTLIFSFCFWIPSFGSHVVGGEITYQYLGNNGPVDRPFQYLIRFVGLVDRIGSPFTPSNWSCGNLGLNPALMIYDAATNSRILRNATSAGWPLPSHGPSGSGPCPIDPYSFPSMRPLVIPDSAACWPTGQSPFSIAITDTSFEVQLPFSAAGYYIKYESCCRTDAITNLIFPVFSDNPGNTWQAFIPPPTLVNASPQFSKDIVPVICVGDTSFFSIAGSDPDNDKLLYKFATPWSGSSSNSSPVYIQPVNVTFKSGFSAQQPFGPYGFASINPSTGMVKLFCSVQGTFAIAFDIVEYRTLPGGTEIEVSTTRRETLINVVVNTATPEPPYIPLPANGAVWNVVRNKACPFPGGRWYYSLRTHGDTLVGNKTYKKLDIPYFYADPASLPACVVLSRAGDYAGAFRQDSLQRKVYFVRPGNGQETLLYDFKLGVGDTLKGHLSSAGFPYIVVSIDSTTTPAGAIRRRWNFLNSLCLLDTFKIVEGIGSMKGLLSAPIPCNADVDNDELLCMAVGNVNQYLSSGQTSCLLVTSTKSSKVSEPGFSIFPNPVIQNKLTVTFSEKGSLTLFDSKGKIVFEKSGMEGLQTFPVSLKTGFYFATIETQNGRKSMKLVVE